MAIRKPLTKGMRDGLLALVYSLVPEMRAYVAGGFAADFTRATDIDLWVLADPLLERATAIMDDYGVKYRQHDEAVDSVPNEDRERSVVVVDTPLRTVHVIGTVEQTLQDLLSTFDISTHRWAMTPAGVRVAGDKATEWWETGRVLTYRFPNSTDARVKKLEARYEISIQPFSEPKKKAS